MGCPANHAHRRGGQHHPAATDHEEAIRLGQQATAKDTRGIFRFNSGKERKTFPDYNPYTIQRCRDCDIAKGKMKLAHAVDNEVCEACSVLNECRSASFTKDKEFGERLLISNIADKTELDDNKRAAASLLRSFPDMMIRIRPHIIEKYLSNPEFDVNNMIADRKGILNPQGITAGFRKAIKQGCKCVIIDLDKQMRNKHFRLNDIAKYLNWRKSDFTRGIIEECYIIYNDRSVLITKDNIEKESIIEVLKTIKPQ